MEKVHIIATQHLDVAWLWKRSPDGEELMRACFERMIEAFEAYPEVRFVFSRSTVWSFYVMEQRYPRLFEQIQKYVQEGKVELCGGQWVEPDHIMPGGEALVRQFLYGQTYFMDKFGQTATVGWSPDIFGHLDTLPQILKKSGLDGYYFHRCRPVDRDGRPLHQFVWEGLDGSQVFALSGHWVGKPEPEVIRAVLEEMESYNLPSVHVAAGKGSDRAVVMETDWLPLPDKVKRDLDLPHCTWSSADEVLRDMQSYAERLPVVRGELGFQFTGTYTTAHRIKRANRQLETMMIQAEALSAWAMLEGQPYPARLLTDAWRDVCLNQFHDILCGTCHNEVLEEALELYADVERKLRHLIATALKSLAGRLNTQALPEGKPYVAFNTVAWARACPAFIPCDAPANMRILAKDGSALPAQPIVSADGRDGLLFAAPDIPAFGCADFYLCPGPDVRGMTRIAYEDRLENDLVLVEIDRATGAFRRIRDKRSGVDLLRPGTLGNHLALYQDKVDSPTPPKNRWGMGSWQTWYIRYTGQTLETTGVNSVEVRESGPVRGCIRTVREMQLSAHLPPTVIIQDIMLYADSPIVHIVTSGNWQAEEMMLKAEFDFSFTAGDVVSDAPYGVSVRPAGWLAAEKQLKRLANPEDKSSDKLAPQEPDRSMHQWLDFADGEKGVAFLNNGKYGFDSDETHVGLSLLRAPHMREGELIGLGEFSFSYAVLPHVGDWRAAELPKLGYGFHHDLLLVDAERHDGAETGMPRLFIAEAANILITAVKKAERDGAMIVRLFESQGRATRTVIHAPTSLADAAECDLLEREAGREDCALEQFEELQVTGTQVSVSFKPYEIKTVKFWWR